MRHFIRALRAPIFAVTAALAILTAGAGAAAADYIYNNGTFHYDNGGGCIDIRSETSHGSHGDGYIKVNMKALKRSLWMNCALEDARPAGWVKVKNELLVSRNGQWYSCWMGPVIYSQSQTNNLVHWQNFGPGTHCGTAYYSNYGRGYLRFDFNQWQGGLVHSGHHHLPV